MKLAIRASPGAPVTMPITNAPTSKTIEPFNKISRQRSASIFSARPPARLTRNSAEMMAGASIAAATATI